MDIKLPRKFVEMLTDTCQLVTVTGVDDYKNETYSDPITLTNIKHEQETHYNPTTQGDNKTLTDVYIFYCGYSKVDGKLLDPRWDKKPETVRILTQDGHSKLATVTRNRQPYGGSTFSYEIEVS